MQQKRFGSYDKEFQLLADTLPMLVSVTKNPDDETKEQFIATHDRFIALDEITKNKLAAPGTAAKIQSIGKLQNLNLTNMSDIARVLRSYYFREFKLEDFPFALSKEMNIDLTRAKEVAKIILEKIISDKSFEEKYAATHENIPVQIALKKYPELGEQLITSERIALKSFPGPVRPSIKNWLADYNFVMGYDKQRSGIERTNYLFHNPNTQRLNPFEREKLSYILKSLDENFPITVNKNTRQVIFPAVPPRTGLTEPGKVSQLPPARFEPSAIKPVPPSAPRPVYQPAPRPAQGISPQPPVQSAPSFRPVAQPALRQPISPPTRPDLHTPQAPSPSAPPPVRKPEIKEPPQIQKKEDKSLRFTSPHTLPFEKKPRGPLRPYRITPFSAGSDENPPEENPKYSKNVINLKE